MSLNPCSNGIWSLTVRKTGARETVNCLNPCSNGIWSLTLHEYEVRSMRPCLNPCSNGIWSLTPAVPAVPVPVQGVLILVLMEYGL